MPSPREVQNGRFEWERGNQDARTVLERRLRSLERLLAGKRLPNGAESEPIRKSLLFFVKSYNISIRGFLSRSVMGWHAKNLEVKKNYHF